MVVTYAGFDAEIYLRDVLGGKNISTHGDELIHSCLLPFGLHKNGDRNPSASLNVDKLVYNCFGCGGGSLLWATQEILGISSAEARRIIEENAQPINQSPAQFREELEKRWAITEVGVPVMPSYSEAMLKPWLCYSKYLDERNISREVQKRMKTGINLQNLDKVGEEWLPQPRLIIPHFFGSKLRGWSARKIDVRQVGPKYRHTPNFPKDYTLYNYDGVSELQEIIVVESPMSVLKLMSEGITNAVATFGAQVTDRQIDLLKKFNKLILFPDGDKAGYATLVDKRNGLITRLKEVDVWIVDHGIHEINGKLRYNNKDAADYDAAELNGLLADKVPAYMWNWRNDELQKVDNS